MLRRLAGEVVIVKTDQWKEKMVRANHLPPSHPLTPCISSLRSHNICTSPLWFSSEPPVYYFKPQNLLTDTLTVSALYASKTSQSVTLKGKLNIFIFTTSFLVFLSVTVSKHL